MFKVSLVVHMIVSQRFDSLHHTVLYSMHVGQGSPVLPGGIQAITVTAYSATVQWMVSYIAYTQEQYSVNYGITRESLDQLSLVVSSSTDTSAANITYDVAVQDLTPNTVYFFQLRSMNTYESTLSAIMTFTTLEAGKRYYHHQWYLVGEN